MAAKSVTLELRVWYDPASKHIKLAGRGLTASTVSNDPHSKRYHPNLYRKLAKCLRDAGAPAPEMQGVFDDIFDGGSVDLGEREQPAGQGREPF